MADTASRIYHASPTWVQNLLLTGYGMKLRRLRYGGVHTATLSSLLKSQWLSARAHREAQLKSLNALLRHARRTVPFYRDAAWPLEKLNALDELRELPLTRKPELQSAGRALVSDSYLGSRLSEVHTGGTTGRPLSIFCDAATLQRNYAFFERLRHWASVPDGCRQATFAGRVLMPADAPAPFWRRNRAANAMLFSSYHISPSTTATYADALAAWSPDLIDSYPSSLEPIAKYLLDAGDTRIRPRAVITSSETLFPEVRTLLERAFECRVFDHYGSAEMVAFVTQCERGSYHVNPEFGVLELLRDGEPAGAGEAGEIVATSLINPAMPLIRYSTGDWATWGVEPCSCGREMPTLREIGGRVDDVIITPEGRLVGRLDPIFKAVASLFECRIVQDAADHLRVEIVASDSLPSAEIETLVDALRDRVGSSMRIDPMRVERIERTSRGKLRTVVNEWRKR